MSTYWSPESLERATVNLFSLAGGVLRARPSSSSYSRDWGFGMEAWAHVSKSQTFKYRGVQLILIICRFSICKSVYSLKYICDPNATLPWWLRGKESACQCRRWGLDLWVRKIPWKRKWHPTPVFLPGKSHGQWSLAGYSPWGHKRIRHDLATKQKQQPQCSAHGALTDVCVAGKN